MADRFDPSLLYAECRRCGSPVILATGPDEAVLWMGIAPDTLGADYLLLYEGCPRCQPHSPVHEPRLVRFRDAATRPPGH